MIRSLLLVRSFYIFASSISSLFLSFYIFQHTGNINTAIYYNFFVYLFLPLSATIAGFICKQYSYKIPNMFGILLLMTGIASVVFATPFILAHVWFLGIIQGIGMGFYFPPINILTQHATNEHNRDFFNGMFGNISTFAGMVMPLVASFIIYYTRSYTFIFITALLLFSMALSTMLFFKAVYPKGKYKIITAARGIFTHIDTRRGIQAIIIMGSFYAMLTVVLPLLALQIFSNISTWGIFNSILTVISMLFTYIYSRVFTIEKAKTPLLLSSFCFAAIGLILGIFYNVYIFFIFIIANTLMFCILSVSYSSAIQDIIDEYEDLQQYIVEYLILQEYALGIGRIFVLGIIFLLHTTTLQSSTISVGLVVMTVTPLLISLSLVRTEVMQLEEL